MRIRPVWLVLVLLAVPALGQLVPVNEAAFQKVVADHKGKVVLYDFWATWCDGCRAELPDLVRLDAKLRVQGFELVTISADEPEQAADAEKFLKHLGVRSPLYRRQADDDQHFIDSIDKNWSGALPAMFLFDKAGRQVRSFIGETDIGVLEAAVRKILQ